MTTDPDGDSQMASSPESTQNLPDDSPAGARTPTNIPRSHFLGGASELSPPGSQPQPTSTGIGGILGLGQGGADVATETTTGAGAGAQQQQQQQLPAWMNKRAEEDYQRAMEYVVDQEWNLDEFGDPFDERDMEEKLL